MNRPSASDQNLAKAVQLHQSGDLDRAIRLYEKVVREQPHHAAALNLLGIASFQAGRAAPAANYLKQALALNPSLPDGHYNLGTMLHALGRFEEALDHHRRALAAKPGDADALNSIGAALKELGRPEEAVEHFRKALALRPNAIEALVNLAAALLAAGDASEAFALVRRALAAGGDTPEVKRLFVACISGTLNYSPGDDLRTLLIRAMTEPWCRPERLMLLADAVVRTNPRVDAAIARAKAAWPHVADAKYLEANELAAASAEPLLNCMLVSAPVRSIALERFVTAARYNLLVNAAKAAASDNVDGNVLRFWCAVAQQSFINGYIHAHADEEFALAQQLRDRLIAAAKAHAPIPSLWVAAVGAYFPLHTLGIAPALLQHRFPETVDALLTQQVREPEQEAEFRAAIPLVTEIDDSLSLAVQQQYEEMPSPRWVRLAPALQPMTFGEYVQLQVPAASIDGFPKTGKFDALVAGCGTGREPIEFAQFVPDARILAVDLSLASLAYARRKSAELGIRNIEFGRGDILKLGTLDRQFDCITAMGSLQCLADPMQGWSILLSRLRPGGLMAVRIYSETGRRDTVAAQKALAGLGFTGTAEDIRRARQEILARMDEAPYKKLSAASELSNLGECRDLLFHVNESRTTMPALRRFIELNDLDFLGFRTSTDVARAYASRFADDPQMTNLEHWDSFEHDNPKSFAGSYEFWVQKRNVRH